MARPRRPLGATSRSTGIALVSWAAAGMLALGVALAAVAIITVRPEANRRHRRGEPRTSSRSSRWRTPGSAVPSMEATGIATQVAVSPDGRQIAFVAGAPATRIKSILRPARQPGTSGDPVTIGGGVSVLVAGQPVHRVLRGRQTERRSTIGADRRSTSAMRNSAAAESGIATTSLSSPLGLRGRPLSGACSRPAGAAPSYALDPLTRNTAPMAVLPARWPPLRLHATSSARPSSGSHRRFASPRSIRPIPAAFPRRVVRRVQLREPALFS